MSTSQTTTLSQAPVIRITPPGDWWAIPFGELWQYRELLYFFVWRDIKIRYKQTVIGAAWAVLQPFLTMLILSLIFGALAHIPSQGLPYPIFNYSALLPWMYFAASLQNATNTIVDNQRVITKVYFPRLALPISAVLSGLVDFAISFLMFVAMMAYYRVHPTLALLWMPVFLLMSVATALGFGLWLSALNAIYRDVRYVVPFLVQIWLFASPVVYPSSLVATRWPKLLWLYSLNPMVGVIEGFRWSLTGSGAPPGRAALISAGIVVAILLAGLAYFQRMETTIADVV